MTQYDGAQFSIFASSYQPRGNVTKTKRWAGASSYIYAFSQYNNAGDVVWSKDPNGNTSTISYADNFGAGSNPDSGVPGPFGPTYAMATLATNALGHQTKTQFDFSRGVLTGVKDPNGVISKTEYDLLGRPTRTTLALGLPEQTIAETTYPTLNANFMTVSKQLDSTRWLASKDAVDGFDRVAISWQAEDGQHASVATYTIRTDTAYDGLGRVKTVSNPYRPASEAPQYTTTVYDLGDRVLSVTTPDNAVVTTSYNGNSVTVTDQAGKARKSVTDALGRLVEVYEDPSGLNYQTVYGYDVFDNLTTVTQGLQTRTFVYDSLKRLRSATNPESGTITYDFDDNGNLSTKTDARGVTITYGYDALNRNTSVNYSNTTIGNPDVADVKRFYDGATNGTGRLWYSYAGGDNVVGSNVEKTLFASYDALGRPRVLQQSFKLNGVWSAVYQTSRSYDLAGGVTSQTYPSGHSVVYNYDNAGRLADKDSQNLALTGNLGDGVQRTYSRGITYAAAGQLKQEQLGTTTPVYNKLFYNSRQQLAGDPCQHDWRR